MRTLRRAVAILGALTTSAAACGLVAVGCGDDNMGSDSGASDATTDVSTDHSTADVSTDVSADVAHDVTADVKGDTTVSDSPADTGPDAKDAGPDANDGAADAHDGSAAADAGPSDAAQDLAPELAFPSQAAMALCQQLALCCGDSGIAFDTTACTNGFLGTGYQNSLKGSGTLTAGNVAFNPDAGAGCIANLDSIGGSCTITAALQPSLLSSCFGALTGKLGVGSPCQDSIECQPTEVCVPNADGGAIGACAALRTVGEPCGDFSIINPSADNGVASQFCSYRGSGSNGTTCNEFDDAGNFLDPSMWTCIAQYTTTSGHFCVNDTDCVSPFICDQNTALCVADLRQLTSVPTTCQHYAADAGDQ